MKVPVLVPNLESYFETVSCGKYKEILFNSITGIPTPPMECEAVIGFYRDGELHINEYSVFEDRPSSNHSPAIFKAILLGVKDECAYVLLETGKLEKLWMSHIRVRMVEK